MRIIYRDPCSQSLSIHLPLNKKQAIAGRQRQMELCEFEASLSTEFLDSQYYQETLSQKNHNQPPPKNPTKSYF